jgi:hypothetical protein
VRTGLPQMLDRPLQNPPGAQDRLHAELRDKLVTPPCAVLEELRTRHTLVA